MWSNFGTWLRTIRPNTLPSEMVTALALSQTYDHFLEDEQDMSIFKKFLLRKIASREVRHQIPSASGCASGSQILWFDRARGGTVVSGTRLSQSDRRKRGRSIHDELQCFWRHSDQSDPGAAT